MIARLGLRKFTLGIVYLLICGTIAGAAVFQGVKGWDAAGVASLFVSMATGVAAIVWGNVQEHRSRNGG